MEELTHAQVIRIEPNTLFDGLEEVAQVHAVSAEPDALFRESEILGLEEVVCTNGGRRIAPTVVRHDWADSLFEEEMACAIITPRAGAESYTILEPPDILAPITLVYLSVFLNAANQQHFPAGSLAIRVANNMKGTKSELALCNTFHAPSVAYTLVSLGAL